MGEDNLSLIDSNVLIYNFDAANPEKHKAAKQLIDKCWTRQREFAISSQNLSEFFYVTTSKKLLTKTTAIHILSSMIDFSGWVKLDFTYKTVLGAAKISEAYQMSFWDSLLVATMSEKGVKCIYTENEKDFKIPWLKVINPFIKKS